MAKNSAAPFHIGLTPERIVDVALELTAESHLGGWSIRDLARRLDVAPSVLYHHIGGKDLICRRVVERVLLGIASPPPELEWAQWFRALLLSFYQTISLYPGVANWVLMHGASFPKVLSAIEAGIAVLVRAGFGEKVGLVHAALTTNAMLTISLGDERLHAGDDGLGDRSAMMDEFLRAAVETPGLEPITKEFVTPYVSGGQEAIRQRERYYRFVVETTIAGVATLLTPEGRGLREDPGTRG